MTTLPWAMFSPFSETIGKFLYNPTTNWQGAFSPSVVFNANPQDGPIEAHILSQVGSYGKQLGTLISMIDMLRLHEGVDDAKLPADQAKALQDFIAMKNAATQAADEFRGRLGADEIVEAAKAFQTNKPADETAALRKKLEQLLGGK